MINALFLRISKYLLFTDEGKQNWHKYEQLTEHAGWKVHQGLLIEIMNEISKYMLDDKFTRLDKEEKDVQQRAFYTVKEIVDFLLNPLKNAQKYAALKDVANKKGRSSKKKIEEPGT